MTDAAIQQKLAAMFAANKDEVSVPKIYIDMTGGWETGAVLDEIMFWTLPKKNTGRTSLRVFRNENLWLAVRRADWWDRKRLTERQADTAIGKLKTQGLIEKDVFLFDGKPTVHLRLITSKFAALYAEKLQEVAAGEEDENLVRDIADLYSMMGFPPQNVNSNLQNGKMLNLQNGKIINSPVQPENNNTKPLLIPGIDAAMFADRPVTSNDLDPEAEALKAFETALHLPGNWQWYPGKGSDEKAWKELRAFVVKLYRLEGVKAFEEYYTWSIQPFSRGAMTVLGIKRNPGDFEASWAAFKASAMLAKKTDEERGEYRPGRISA